MKTGLWLPILALLLLAMASCEKDAALVPGTDDQQQAVSMRKNAEVPFKGTYTTYPEFVSIDDNGTQTFRIPSEGKATHLGKSTWYSDSQVFNTLIQPAPWLQTGTSIFTAADGSTLEGTFTGTTQPLPPYPFSGSGTYTITFGTKRFAGASGGGTYSYYVEPDFSKAHLEFTGTLVNP